MKVIEITFYIALVVLIIVGRVLYGSYSEYKTGLRYIKDDPDEAVLHFSYAIKWHLPLFNPYEKKAIDEAFKIAEEFEKKKKLKDALEVYRIIRGAIYSTRSFYMPHRDIIKKCDDRISDLVAETEWEKIRWGITNKTELKFKSLLILKRDLDPSLFWVIILEIGFIGWVASVIMFILKAFRGRRLDNRVAIFFGSSFFLFYAAWIIGLWRA